MYLVPYPCCQGPEHGCCAKGKKYLVSVCILEIIGDSSIDRGSVEDKMVISRHGPRGINEALIECLGIFPAGTVEETISHAMQRDS